MVDKARKMETELAIKQKEIEEQRIKLDVESTKYSKLQLENKTLS
jgi:hypothetical protein